jgi:hypothetical protein
MDCPLVPTNNLTCLAISPPKRPSEPIHMFSPAAVGTHAGDPSTPSHTRPR